MQVLATGCPSVRKRTTDLGDFPLSGYPPGFEDVPGDLAPRRIVLDKILVDGATAAGTELREDFSVEDVLWDGNCVEGVPGRSGGKVVEERARVVVGADGQYSVVARRVGAVARCATPPLTFGYYSYWEGVPIDGIEAFHRPEQRRVLIAFPPTMGSPPWQSWGRWLTSRPSDGIWRATSSRRWRSHQLALLRLQAALRGNQLDTDRSYGVEFGTVAREDYYAPANIARIIAATRALPV